MITKVRVLGLRAADRRGVTAAASRIIAYLQGGSDNGQTPDLGAAGSQPPLGGTASGPSGGVDPLARVAAYYEAGPDGRSTGRARGAGASLLGLSGAVTTEQLMRALTGRHPLSATPLIPPKGSARRAADHPDGSRWAPARGPGDERLTLGQAAYLTGVSPARLRLLAAHQPKVRFAAPTPSDQVDPRVARKLIEALTGWPLSVPLPGADRDFLLAERDPRTNDWVLRRAELERYQAERLIPETVIGFDLVCAAPKSVSLLWAVGDERIRAEIAAATDAAVDAVISYLETHGCYGMVDGTNHHGDGLAAVSYVHDTSRSNDAHLHVHNIILNAVRVTVRDDVGNPVCDEHGQPRTEWRTLDSGALLRHVKTAGYIGAAELRHQLSTRWGVGWTATRNGVAEIDGFPPELLRAFSTRHDQITEEFAQLVESGRPADAATEEAAQRATRAAKTVLADTAVRAIQADKLTQLGWTPERIRDLIGERRRTAPAVTEADIAELHDTLTGPAGLTERHTTFTSREVHQAVAVWAGDRLTDAQVRDLAEAFLADPRVVACGADRSRTRQDPDPIYTTENLLAAEDNLHTLYRHGRCDHGSPAVAALAPVDAARSVADLNRLLPAERADADARISDEQSQLVADILTSGDLIRCVIGPAGTGKTETMRAAVAAWQAAGYTVLGCANGGAQTEQLAKRLGIDAQVVRAWLTRLDTTDDPATVWPQDTVVVIDEATQVSTRDAERLCRWSTRTGTVLVFIGDPAQLGAVGAGGWFRHIVYTDGAPSLTAVYRQAGADMAEVRAALAGLRSEVPARVHKAMDRLAADGRIRIYDNADAILTQVVDDWYADRQHRLDDNTGRPPKPSRMMAAHHRDVDALNQLARRRLIADGTITGPQVVVGERSFALGDEVVTLTQEGHSLVPTGADRRAYIRTGTTGTVTGIQTNPAEPSAQSVEVLFPGRGRVHVDWAYLSHDFPDGRAGGLAHAYAITADRSQGSTMHTARAVGTDSTSRAAFYVMLSRGERDVAAYLACDRDLTQRAEDEQWLPVLRHPGGPFDTVAEHLERSRTERLAGDLDPEAADVHALRRAHTLSELTAIRRGAEDHGGRDFTVARRAELAEQAAVGALAIRRPTPELTARLGRRPPSGDHRRAWDQAVRAAAAYRARWQTEPGPAGYGAGPRWAIGERPPPELSRWRQQRAQAELLVTRWAATLDPLHRRRFSAVIEYIPRERAIAGIHALLAAGYPPAEVESALHERETGTVRAGAAILDHRVANLLAEHDVDANGYRLPEPLTAASEWDHVERLLHSAEAESLSLTPTKELADERRRLAGLLTGHTPRPDIERLQADVSHVTSKLDQADTSSDEALHQLALERTKPKPDRHRITDLQSRVNEEQRLQTEHTARIAGLETDRTLARRGEGDDRAVRDRHQRVTRALDLQVDRAIASVATSAPAYLTDFLGDRPADPAAADTWDRRARHIETWRHHTLGLPHGTPAAPAQAPPSQQALGPVPDEPVLASARGRLIHDCQATLDLGAAL